MFELQTFALFLAAATVVAVTPGPGIFYIVARTLAGGRTEGLASSVGLGLGGFVHVLAGAIGISALVMASAEAFTALKIVVVPPMPMESVSTATAVKPGRRTSPRAA